MSVELTIISALCGVALTLLACYAFKEEL